MNSHKNKIKIKSHQDDGFTLIEVLIAIAIFSIGILAVASLQTYALTQTRSSRITTECLTLATQHAERLMALPFYDPSDVDFTTHPADLVEGTYTAEDDEDFPRYQIQWTVIDDVPIGPLGPEYRLHATNAAITVSKTVRIQVAPLNNLNDIRASLEFVKVLGLLESKE